MFQPQPTSFISFLSRWHCYGDLLQGWFYVCAQPMRDGVTLKLRISMAGCRTRISPVACSLSCGFTMRSLSFCIANEQVFKHPIWLRKQPQSIHAYGWLTSHYKWISFQHSSLCKHKLLLLFSGSPSAQLFQMKSGTANMSVSIKILHYLISKQESATPRHMTAINWRES